MRPRDFAYGFYRHREAVLDGLRLHRECGFTLLTNKEDLLESIEKYPDAIWLVNVDLANEFAQVLKQSTKESVYAHIWISHNQKPLSTYNQEVFGSQLGSTEDVFNNYDRLCK